jgi:hypothetical protein
MVNKRGCGSSFWQRQSQRPLDPLCRALFLLPGPGDDGPAGADIVVSSEKDILGLYEVIYNLDIKGHSVRTLIDIPEDDFALLKDVVGRLAISRAEFVRRAIVQSLNPYRQTMSHEAFGLWASHPVDGLEYQERLRSEW